MKEPRSFLVRGNGKIQKKLREIARSEWSTQTYRWLLLTYNSGTSCYWVLGDEESVELAIEELSGERGIAYGIFVNPHIEGEGHRIKDLVDEHKSNLKGSDI